MAASFDTRRIADVLETSVERIEKCSLWYGIPPSISPRPNQSARKRYSADDFCRLDMALWLFRAGLRRAAIVDILGDERVRAILRRVRSPQIIRSIARRSVFLVVGGFSEGERRNYKFIRLERALPRGRHWESGSVALPMGSWLLGLADHVEDLTAFRP